MTSTLAVGSRRVAHYGSWELRVMDNDTWFVGYYSSHAEKNNPWCTLVMDEEMKEVYPVPTDSYWAHMGEEEAEAGCSLAWGASLLMNRDIELYYDNPQEFWRRQTLICDFQAARRLEITIRQVRQWVKSGKLSGEWMGGAPRVHLGAIEDYKKVRGRNVTRSEGDYLMHNPLYTTRH